MNKVKQKLIIGNTSLKTANTSRLNLSVNQKMYSYLVLFKK